MMKCDWCQSIKVKHTGGFDWGRKIMVCECGHEFLGEEDPVEHKKFWDMMEESIDEITQNNQVEEKTK
jgi:hypothetical protein